MSISGLPNSGSIVPEPNADTPKLVPNKKMTDLPVELMAHILSFLSPEQQAKFSLVHKANINTQVDSKLQDFNLFMPTIKGMINKLEKLVESEKLKKPEKPEEQELKTGKIDKYHILVNELKNLLNMINSINTGDLVNVNRSVIFLSQTETHTKNALISILQNVEGGDLAQVIDFEPNEAPKNLKYLKLMVGLKNELNDKVARANFNEIPAFIQKAFFTTKDPQFALYLISSLTDDQKVTALLKLCTFKLFVDRNKNIASSIQTINGIADLNERFFLLFNISWNLANEGNFDAAIKFASEIPKNNTMLRSRVFLPIVQGLMKSGEKDSKKLINLIKNITLKTSLIELSSTASYNIEYSKIVKNWIRENSNLIQIKNREQEEKKEEKRVE